MQNKIFLFIPALLFVSLVSASVSISPNPINIHVFPNENYTSNFIFNSDIDSIVNLTTSDQNIQVFPNTLQFVKGDNLVNLTFVFPWGNSTSASQSFDFNLIVSQEIPDVSPPSPIQDSSYSSSSVNLNPKISSNNSTNISNQPKINNPKIDSGNTPKITGKTISPSVSKKSLIVYFSIFVFALIIFMIFLNRKKLKKILKGGQNKNEKNY